MNGDFEERVLLELGGLNEKLDAHGEKIEKLDTAVREIEVDRVIAKKAGAKAGRNWALPISAAVVAIAETARAWLGAK